MRREFDSNTANRPQRGRNSSVKPAKKAGEMIRKRGVLMSITVRFFASIRERLGKAEVALDAAGVRDVADVWERVTGVPRPARLLAAVNLEHAGFDRPVRDGDEVGFFPPVTGG